MNKLLGGSVRKRRSSRRYTKMEVLKQLQAAMDAAKPEGGVAEEKPPKELENEFFTTGRIGRRNALPDILAEHCTTGTADLPENFSALSTQDATTTKNSAQQPGPSEPQSNGSSSSKT